MWNRVLKIVHTFTWCLMKLSASVQTMLLVPFLRTICFWTQHTFINARQRKGCDSSRRKKNVRFPECLTQSDVWHSCEQTPARGKSVLVPCLVDRTYLGHQSRLILGMKKGWCYLLPYLALHAFDTSHRVWLNHEKIWTVRLLNPEGKLKPKSVRVLLTQNETEKKNNHCLYLY